MKKFVAYRLVMIFGFVLAGLSGCDTEQNIEDPALDYFVKYYGGNGDQFAVDMLALADGNFLLLGNYKLDDFNTDVYLLRVDPEGNVVWELRIGQNDPDIWNAKDIEPTLDGNFIVLADFKSNNGALTDIKLLKISNDGQLLDTSAPIGTAANDFSRTVTPVDDGSFVISGTTELTDDWGNPSIPDPDVGNFVNYRVNQNLDLFPVNDWTPPISGFGGRLDVAVKAFPFFLGGTRYFYVFGHSKNTLHNAELEGLFYFLRDDLGGESTNLSVRHGNDTQIQFVLPAAAEFGGGFVVVGTTQGSLGATSIYLGRLRSNLQFNDTQDFPAFNDSDYVPGNIRGVSAGNSVVGEQGFLILGNEVRSTGAANIWLSKIDQSGRLLWSTTLGSETEDDTSAAVAELPDGKIVILGTMGLADNQLKMAFIKMNRRGQFLK